MSFIISSATLVVPLPQIHFAGVDYNNKMIKYFDGLSQIALKLYFWSQTFINFVSIHDSRDTYIQTDRRPDHDPCKRGGSIFVLLLLFALKFKHHILCFFPHIGDQTLN